jgi:hypothetical protein
MLMDSLDQIIGGKRFVEQFSLQIDEIVGMELQRLPICCTYQYRNIVFRIRPQGNQPDPSVGGASSKVIQKDE